MPSPSPKQRWRKSGREPNQADRAPLSPEYVVFLRANGDKIAHLREV